MEKYGESPRCLSPAGVVEAEATDVSGAVGEVIVAADIRRPFLLILRSFLTVVNAHRLVCLNRMVSSDISADPVLRNLSLWDDLQFAFQGMGQFTGFDEWESAWYNVMQPFMDEALWDWQQQAVAALSPSKYNVAMQRLNDQHAHIWSDRLGE